MKSSDIAISVTFKCGECDTAAEIIEVNDALNHVRCPSCGISVDGDNARLMHETLRLCYIKQEGSNIIRRELRKRRMGRIPLRKISDEFSDPQWPFILKVNRDP